MSNTTVSRFMYSILRRLERTYLQSLGASEYILNKFDVITRRTNAWFQLLDDYYCRQETQK